MSRDGAARCVASSVRVLLSGAHVAASRPSLESRYSADIGISDAIILINSYASRMRTNLSPYRSNLSLYSVGTRQCTLLGVQSWVRFCQQEFGEFPRLVGRYCSYLLPKQAGGTPQILVDKTSPMTGRLRVYTATSPTNRIGPTNASGDVSTWCIYISKFYGSNPDAKQGM